jgi:hypothetical protein
MGHTATKPDKVNIGITKDFRDQNLVMWLLKSSICYLKWYIELSLYKNS